MNEIIKKLCEQNNITLAYLQKELGFGKNAISRWDDSSPAIEKVDKVAEYFDVSIDYLYGNTDNPKEILGLTDDERLFLDVYAKAQKSDKKSVKAMLKIIDSLLGEDEDE